MDPEQCGKLRDGRQKASMRIPVICLLLFAVGGCSKTRKPVAETVIAPSSPVPTVAPYFSLGDSDRNQLFKSARELKVGMSRNEVVTKLGQPTREGTVTSKKGVFKNHALYFYTQIWKRDTVNERRDEYLRLSFDAEHRLTAIQTNLEQLQSIATKPLSDPWEGTEGGR